MKIRKIELGICCNRD